MDPINAPPSGELCGLIERIPAIKLWIKTSTLKTHPTFESSFEKDSNYEKK